MRILMVNALQEKNHFQNAFRDANIADLRNLIMVSSFEAAQEFITNALSAGGEHIDLIITADWMFQNTYSTHLTDWKNNSELNYSGKNFKVAAIPIILFDREIRSSDNYYRYGFDAIAERNEYDNYTPLFQAARSAVKTFRNHIYNDLDLLEIDPDALQSGLLLPLQNLYYLRRYKKNNDTWATRTKVLSSDFIASPRQLLYPWLEQQLLLVEHAICLYEDVLKIPKFNRVHSEKRILHQLYNKHKILLIGDVYNGLAYEPALMKNKREYEEPDYIRTTGLPAHIPTDIAEIKLPTMGLLQRRKRKPNLKQGFSDALVQVSDYKRHLRSAKSRRDLAEQIGYAPGSLTYTLLASNNEELGYKEKRVKELLKDQHANIQLVTHHDQLEWLYKLHERLSTQSGI